MRVAFYSCSAVLTELPLPGGLPGNPLFLPGTFRDCGFFEGLLYCKTVLFKKRRKSDPIQCSKASQKGKKSSPLDFHKMSSLKFLTEIRYFSLCELRFGGIWLQPVIWLVPGRLLPAPPKVQNSQKIPSGLTSGKPYFSFRGPSGTAVFWSTQKHLTFSRKSGLPYLSGTP